MPSTALDTTVALEDVARTFGRGEGEVRALDGVSLALEAGTFTAIMGPSGSGKSTLLQLAAGLDGRRAGGWRSTAATSPGCPSGRSRGYGARGWASWSSRSTCLPP